MGKVTAVCISGQKGQKKENIGSALLIENHGLQNDAHAGEWHRQVSLLSSEEVEAFRAKGAQVGAGDFGENLLVSGIDFKSFPVGTRLLCNNVVLEITQIGKECHSHCAIYNQVGDCIMPRAGVFARVLRGGTIKAGDEMTVLENKFRAAVITASDKGYAGERNDQSGALLQEILESKGYQITSCQVLPDDRAMLEIEMKKLCDGGLCDVLFTTGGTGFSPRDITPEATLAIAHRLVPGISEAMRAASMQKTRRAMLSRGVSVIRERTLIVNLPGSPKAVQECLEAILDTLPHGLEVLRGEAGDCAR